MDDKKATTIQEAREALAARKENRRKQNPTEIVHKMYRMNFEGNIIPHSWYTHIKRENGKPYTIAIVLLSEIVYWYRPQEVKDEATGQIIGLRKRYAADKLQRTYDSFADGFGFTKRQVKDALKHLEGMAIIDLDLRDIPVGDNVAGNVLFIGLDPDRLAEITYRPPSDEKTIDPLPSNENLSEVYQFNDRGLTENRQTNTEITPETTPEITEEDISLSAQKTDSPSPEAPAADGAAIPEQEGGDDNGHQLGRPEDASIPGGSDNENLATSDRSPVSQAVLRQDIRGQVGLPPPDDERDHAPGRGAVDPLMMPLERHTEAQREAVGDWTRPPSAGGDDGAAEAALAWIYHELDSEPPEKGSPSWLKELGIIGEVLCSRGVKDIATAADAGRAFGRANVETPHFANVHLASFPTAFGIYVGRAKKQVGKTDTRRAHDSAVMEASLAALEERKAARPPPAEDDKVGQAVKRELELQMSKPTYQTYVECSGMTCDNGVLTVTAPDETAKGWLESRLATTIQGQAIGVVGKQVEVRFEVNE